MKLNKVTIQNFRSIKNCTVSLKEVTAIIGENNAGKTALLRALNSLFNWDIEAQYFGDNTHQYAVRANTKIEVTFEEIPNRPYYEDKIENDSLTLILKYSYGNKTRKKSLSYKVRGQEFLIDDSFITLLKNDIDYVYIPASRSNNDLKWTNNSIFARVLTAYSKQHSERRDNISRQVEKVANVLKKNVFSKLENEIGKASLLDSGETYNLQYYEDIDYTLFLDKVGLSIEENGRTFPVTEYGSGIKSLSVIALFRVLAQLEDVSVILGIEEPETNLHPHAQKKFIASIINERQNTEVQAILATHSTVIVDELQHEDIILARRVIGKKRGYYTTYTQLEHNFWDVNKLDEYKHNNFFRYKNSEFFFARYVVIVESTTDAQVIKHLVESEIGDRKYYISILNLDGIKNLKYPYFLLKSLGIPFSMVVDHDFVSPYINNKLEDSREEITYLPKYKSVINYRNPVLNDLWVSDYERSELEDCANKSYTELFKVLSRKKLYIMQYCLEMDLVAGKAARARYCEEMGVTDNSNAYKELLHDKKDAIKAPDKIMRVVTGLAPSQYPYSFKKIMTALIADITNALLV
ncbi:MAG: AAA family ATPase [Mogibacterium sp.]|nr:AAA family ATPase [Mogibacterium sp.]